MFSNFRIPIENAVNRSDSFYATADNGELPKITSTVSRIAADNPQLPEKEDKLLARVETIHPVVVSEKASINNSSKEFIQSNSKDNLQTAISSSSMAFINFTISVNQASASKISQSSDAISFALPLSLSSATKDFLKTPNIEHFIISYTVASGKVTRLQVGGAANVTLMEVNLKKWEERA